MVRDIDGIVLARTKEYADVYKRQVIKRTLKNQKKVGTGYL